jgi:hypothetical protein
MSDNTQLMPNWQFGLNGRQKRALPNTYSFDGSGRLKSISLGFDLFEDCKTARNHLTMESQWKAEIKIGGRK